MLRLLKATLSIMIALTLLTGCASMTKKFTTSKSEDLAPFADQTLALVGEITKGYTPAEMLYLRDFIDENDPEIKHVFALRAQANSLFRGIIAYSVQIVALAESDIPDAEKAARLADFIEDLEKPVIEQNIVEINITGEEFEAVLADMRSRKTLFDGLAAAQPMINEVSRHGGEILSEISLSLERVGAGIDQKIEAQFGHLRDLVKTLEEEEKLASRGIQLLHQYQRGDREVITELKSLKLAGLIELIPSKKMTTQDVSRIEYFLISRLETNNKIIKNVDHSINFYAETHAELDRVGKEKDEEIRKGRQFLILWARAHLRMASGKFNPAEWYDVKQLPAQLLSMGTKAIF